MSDNNIFNNEGKVIIEKLAKLNVDKIANIEYIGLNTGSFLFITLSNPLGGQKLFLISQETKKSLGDVFNKLNNIKYISNKKALDCNNQVLDYMEFRDEDTKDVFFFDKLGQSPEHGEQGYRYIGEKNSIVWRLSDKKCTHKSINFLNHDKLRFDADFISNKMIRIREGKKVLYGYNNEAKIYNEEGVYDDISGPIEISYNNSLGNTYLVGYKPSSFADILEKHKNRTTIDAHSIEYSGSKISFTAELNEAGYQLEDIVDIISNSKDPGKPTSNVKIITYTKDKGYRLRNSNGDEYTRSGGKISKKPTFAEGGYGYPPYWMLQQNNKVFFIKADNGNYAGGYSGELFRDDGFDEYKEHINPFILHMKNNGKDILVPRIKIDDHNTQELLNNNPSGFNKMDVISSLYTIENNRLYFVLSNDKSVYIIKQYYNKTKNIKGDIQLILILNNDNNLIIQNYKYIIGNSIEGKHIFFSPLVEEVPGDESYTPPAEEIWKKIIECDERPIPDINDGTVTLLINGKNYTFSRGNPEIYGISGQFKIILSTEEQKKLSEQIKGEKYKNNLNDTIKELNNFMDTGDLPLPF